MATLDDEEIDDELLLSELNFSPEVQAAIDQVEIIYLQATYIHIPTISEVVVINLFNSTHGQF